MEIDYDAAAKTAPSTSNLPFLEADNDYKLLVLDSKPYTGEKGNKYIIKVRVLEVKATGKTESPAVGSDRAVIINMDNKRYSLPNLMNYATGLNGGPIDSAGLRQLVGVAAKDSTPALEAMAIGMLVANRTVGGMTQGTPAAPSHPITYHNWAPVKQTPAEVMARKAAIKAGQPIP